MNNWTVTGDDRLSVTFTQAGTGRVNVARFNFSGGIVDRAIAKRRHRKKYYRMCERKGLHK